MGRISALLILCGCAAEPPVEVQGLGEDLQIVCDARWTLLQTVQQRFGDVCRASRPSDQWPGSYFCLDLTDHLRHVVQPIGGLHAARTLTAEIYGCEDGACYFQGDVTCGCSGCRWTF